MIVSLGFIRSSSQVLIKQLDWQQNSLDSRIVDVTDLVDENLQGLYIDDNEHFDSLIGILEKEKSYYPIIDAKDDNLSYTSFESLHAHEFKDAFLRVTSRWTMHQNFQTVENIWSTLNHFRELWPKDRLSFFEELWYWMKRNLGASDLSIIFNDIIASESSEEKEEIGDKIGDKRERPKLIQSLLSGSKKAHFISGGPKEKELMLNYLDKFHEVFEITEFNPTKGHFVATAQIERSPMIFMARIPQLNQLQRSLFAGFFNGLQL